MMNVDIPDQPSGLRAAKPPKRSAPCAGLFGWRKEGAPPREAKPEKSPGRDYPVG
ncbi:MULTISPECIES: hypothetical protein [unclassified Sphingopyxis]|jgi:hypothetical protein|uniref:hypothetical protein n=2 Tax=unclassified Sphingopyxis TaxID=2614943 RepID=UPI0012E34D1A|nr:MULTISPECIES: hypothetical protein [unclassified Sphingopyxis]